MLIVRTAHLSHGGIGAAFAPSRGLLNWGLDRRDQLDGLTDAAWIVYSRNYIKEMRVSYVEKRPAWDLLLAMSEVTLCCACKDPTQCHRTVLARDILRKLGAKYEGER